MEQNTSLIFGVNFKTIRYKDFPAMQKNWQKVQNDFWSDVFRRLLGVFKK